MLSYTRHAGTPHTTHTTLTIVAAYARNRVSGSVLPGDMTTSRPPPVRRRRLPAVAGRTVAEGGRGTPLPRTARRGPRRRGDDDDLAPLDSRCASSGSSTSLMAFFSESRAAVVTSSMEAASVRTSDADRWPLSPASNLPNRSVSAVTACGHATTVHTRNQGYTDARVRQHVLRLAAVAVTA